MFSSVMRTIFARAPTGAQAMWGVRTQFGAESRGESMGIGSTLATSMAAPRSFPDFSASASAFSSTSGPRAVFNSMAPSFILEMALALISPCVSAVRGQWREITSLRRSSSSKDT